MPQVKETTDTHQRCSTCKEMKPYEDFYLDRTTKNGYSCYCKSCQKQYAMAYRQTDKYRRKVRRMRWKQQGIDITYEQYELLLAEHDGKCAVCGKSSNQFGKGMCVDHDHETGAVRGILCTDCNMGIGNLKDDLDLMYKAVTYLEQYKMKAVF